MGTNWNIPYTCLSPCLLVQCELYHWIDLLDKFDLILEQAAQDEDESKRTSKVDENDTSCIFMCPRLEDPKVTWNEKKDGGVCVIIAVREKE